MPIHAVNTALQNRTFVKVIAGIDTFDPAKVMPVVDAATAAGAHAIDIACDPELIRQVKARTTLAVFVSATEPQKLIAAAQAGADVLELGNFDAMYREGRTPTAAEILDWTRAVKAAVGDSLPLCVTVCGRLPLNEQVDLAQMLQAAGADIIQAEGQVGPEPVTDTASAIASITSALANAAEIRRAIEMPIFVAGGITPNNAAFAIAAGANGVGVGKAVSSQQTDEARATVARGVVAALEAVRTAHPGLKA
jgi:thiamine monophosphate synthase